MRPPHVTRRAMALLLTACVVASGWYQVSRLSEAIDLFEKQRYVDAHALLKEIDRASLSATEQAEYDRTLTAVQKTLAAAEKAHQDFAAAETAFQQSDWPQADALYTAVIDNTYTETEMRTQAVQRRTEARSHLGSGTSPAKSMQPMSGSGGGPTQPTAAAPVSRPPAGRMEPMTSIGGSAPRATRASAPPPPPLARVQASSPPAPVRVSSVSGPAPVRSGGPMSPMDPAAASAGPPAPRSAISIAAGSGRDTPVDEMKARDELLWQRAMAMLDSLSTEARAAVARGEFESARHAAEQALEEVEAARLHAEPVGNYTSARERALALLREVADAAERHGILKADEQRGEIQQLLVERTEAIEKQKAEKIEQLFATANQLRKEQRFSEEAEIYRQVLYTDPSNSQAKNALELAEDYSSFFQQQDWHDQLQYQQRRSLTIADEALIPYDYEVTYPRNWAEIAARRESLGPGVTGQSLEDIELNKKLDQVLPTVGFVDAEFEKVIEYMQEQTKINYAVDWEDLEARAIERDKPVTLSLANVAARTVLNEILTQVGGDVRLTFSVGDGLLRVASKEKLDRDKFVLVYDIRDLLVNVPQFTNAAQLDPAQALQGVGQGGGVGGGGGGGGGGQNLFQQGQGRGQQEAGNQQGLVDQIMDIIRQTVEPDSWRETGGGDASLRELNGQLIVYNTSDSHRQVQSLLKQLRDTRSLQIALEARYLNVTNNFLEEIGVDLDFVFNSGSAGFDRGFTGNGTAIIDPFTGAPVLIPRPLSQIGTLPAVPGFGTPFTAGSIPRQPYESAGLVPTGTGLVPRLSDATPITFQQGSIGMTDPANFNTQVPGSFAGAAAAPALNIAGSILDNLQVDFLIRATHANGRSSVVQAPRILMFNGQRSNITVGRARSYVSSLNPILAEGAVGFQPVQAVAQSGVTLDVEGTISADRKYVTVTVQTTQSEEPDLTRFEVQRQSGNSPGSFVTLIDQRFVTINTTVSIPDGGTILLGGLKQAGEVEVEAGVPILSKIPILKRAFTNSTMIKDTRTLLILMKAKILIRDETEEEAFPTFAPQAG